MQLEWRNEEEAKVIGVGKYGVSGTSLGNIWARTGSVGGNVKIHSPIGSPDKPLDYVYIGDNVYVGPGCNIQVPQLVVGDYTKIHRNGLIYGRNPLNIGYNCWFGENTIIDCEGHTNIGNGVGVGAYSQLWSHIRHGDILEGCRYLQYGELTIEDDVWFVGHCIVSPIHAARKSVALVGSVVTKDMQENRVYGGSPAKDLTGTLGEPFQPRKLMDKFETFMDLLNAFYNEYDYDWYDIVCVDAFQPEGNGISPTTSQFNIATRTYTKKGTEQEQTFMKFILPEAKFVPEGESLPNVY